MHILQITAHAHRTKLKRIMLKKIRNAYQRAKSTRQIATEMSGIRVVVG